MTGISIEAKVDSLETRLRTALAEAKEPLSPIDFVYPQYTNFSGYYPGLTGLTQQELAEDCRYADSVRRHNFW